MAVLAIATPEIAAAITLDLPQNAEEAGADLRQADQIMLPVGPRNGPGGRGLIAEGRIDRRAWDLPDSTATPFQILSPVIDQLESSGFTTRYSCRDRECGGFDFLLALDLLPAPAMHVDLGDFRYITVERTTDAGPEVVSLVASRSTSGGHLHLTLVSPADAAESLRTSRTLPAEVTLPEPAEFSNTLDNAGRAILSDLEFRPGSSELGDGPFPSLDDVAAWLTANPDRTLILVGHSDNIGSLEDNVRLSERRATAVATALIRDYAIDQQRLSARGVGYLAPIATNATPEGRRQNRRVEAVAEAP